jgi:eukaryotic-like serine/threonine-protein kinase
MKPLHLFFLCLCFFWGSCAASQPQYHEDWPALHQNAERSPLLRSGPAPPLKEAWTFQTEGRLLYPPVAHAGVLYFGSRDSHIYAVDASTGNQIWKTPVEVGGLFSSPTIVDGRLYGGRWNPYYFIYGWDAATGETLWQKETGDLVNRSPWVLAQQEPSPTQKDAFITVLYSHQDPPLGTSMEAQKVVQTAWEIGPEKTAQPRLRWQQALPGVPTVASALAVKSRAVLVALDNQRLYALSQQDGHILWQQELVGEPASAPLTRDGRVFITTRNGYLYAFEAATGALQFRYQFTDAALDGDLALAEEQLFVPGERMLYTFDLSSREPGWKYRFPGLITTPVVTHDHVYVGSATRALFIMDRQKGYITGTFPVSGEVLASPMLMGGKVFVACTDGKLYALEEGPRPQLVRPNAANAPNNLPNNLPPRKPSTSRW